MVRSGPLAVLASLLMSDPNIIWPLLNDVPLFRPVLVGGGVDLPCWLA